MDLVMGKQLLNRDKWAKALEDQESYTDLLVDLSFVQTGYLLPLKVSITIQTPEGSARENILKGYCWSRW